MMPSKTSARSGMAMKYTVLSFGLMRREDTVARMSIIGQRMAMRIIIWNAI